MGRLCGAAYSQAGEDTCRRPCDVWLSVLSRAAGARSVTGMKAALRTHSGITEIVLVVALYAMYEVVRGFGSTTLAAARSHTADIVALERYLGLFIERAVQHAVENLPAVPMLLGFAYMSLHFGATAAALIWVHRSHRDRFGLVRTTLVISTSISLAI